MHRSLVKLVACDTIRSRFGRGRGETVGQSVSDELGHRVNTTVIGAEHLRKESPERDGRSIDAGRIEFCRCLSEGRCDSLFRNQRSEKELVVASRLGNPLPKGIQHRGGPPCPSLRIEFPKDKA